MHNKTADSTKNTSGPKSTFDVLKQFFTDKTPDEDKAKAEPSLKSETASVKAKKKKAKLSPAKRKAIPKNEAKYEFVKQHINRNIESGKWSVDSKVPSENELTQLFDVSRMTARRALQELTAEGVLIRKKGAGSFVAATKEEVTAEVVQGSETKILSVADIVSQKGHQYRFKQCLLKSTAVTAELSSLLSLSDRERVFYSEVMHYDNDQAIQLEQHFIKSSQLPDYLLQSFNNMTPDSYIKKEYPAANFSVEVSATIVNAEIADKLTIEPASLCLVMSSKIYNQDKLIGVAIATSPADKYSLKIN